MLKFFEIFVEQRLRTWILNLLTLENDQISHCVEILVNEPSHLNEVLANVFSHNQVFHSIRQQVFLNLQEEFKDIPVYIAIAYDQMLKQPSDKDNFLLPMMLDITSMLVDRELFLCSYSYYLMQRIMSADESQLQREVQFVDKLTKALDIVSLKHFHSIIEEVNESKRHNSLPTINATVYPQSQWVMHDKVYAQQLPPEMSMLQYNFANAYQERHQRRRLSWLVNQGDAVMQVLYLKEGECFIKVTTLQAAILLCFNHTPSLTKETYEYTLGINRTLINQAIEQLSTKPGKQLIKVSNEQIITIIDQSDQLETPLDFSKEASHLSISYLRHQLKIKARQELEQFILNELQANVSHNNQVAQMISKATKQALLDGPDTKSILQSIADRYDYDLPK
ncbi:hypothetical protein FGO68_gene7488 [Halteria grandinella]|uniref:Cullin family profile domain-containing protein n=1 Tax=Halteria grandinella TaxID=5974 RepID=A0A8J8T5M2_HALGN|nr:hypothetical protein FGO68_gene7488 [Halteria grandinella]